MKPLPTHHCFIRLQERGARFMIRNYQETASISTIDEPGQKSDLWRIEGRNRLRVQIPYTMLNDMVSPHPSPITKTDIPPTMNCKTVVNTIFPHFIACWTDIFKHQHSFSLRQLNYEKTYPSNHCITPSLVFFYKKTQLFTLR